MDNTTGVCKSAVIVHVQTCIPHNKNEISSNTNFKKRDSASS